MTTMQQRLRALEEKLLPPEYYAARKLVEQAQRMLITPPTDEAAAVVSKLNPASTNQIQEDWITACIDAKDFQDRLVRRRGVLGDLIRDTNAQISALAQSINEDMLAGFDAELQGLLDEVAKVAEQLGGVRSAEEAIAADRVTVWRRLAALVEDYEALRQAQRSRTGVETLHQARAHGGEDHASDLYIRNLDEVWPQWRSGDGAVRHLNLDGRPHRYEPWPAQYPQLLLWLATSEAEPWIPTTLQLEQLRADRLKRLDPTPKQVVGPNPSTRTPRTLGKPKPRAIGVL